MKNKRCSKDILEEEKSFFLTKIEDVVIVKCQFNFSDICNLDYFQHVSDAQMNI